MTTRVNMLSGVTDTTPSAPSRRREGVFAAHQARQQEQTFGLPRLVPNGFL